MTTHMTESQSGNSLKNLPGEIQRAGYQFYIEPEVQRTCAVRKSRNAFFPILSRATRESRLRVKLSISRFPGGSFIIHKFHRSVLRGGL